MAGAEAEAVGEEGGVAVGGAVCVAVPVPGGQVAVAEAEAVLEREPEGREGPEAPAVRDAVGEGLELPELQGEAEREAEGEAEGEPVPAPVCVGVRAEEAEGRPVGDSAALAEAAEAEAVGVAQGEGVACEAVAVDEAPAEGVPCVALALWLGVDVVVMVREGPLLAVTLLLLSPRLPVPLLDCVGAALAVAASVALPHAVGVVLPVLELQAEAQALTVGVSVALREAERLPPTWLPVAVAEMEGEREGSGEAEAEGELEGEAELEAEKGCGSALRKRRNRRKMRHWQKRMAANGVPRAPTRARAVLLCEL